MRGSEREALDEAMVRAHGMVPCWEAPRVWDGDGSARQVASAMLTCRTCPVLAQCQAWVATRPGVRGVVAGAWSRAWPDEKVPVPVSRAVRLVARHDLAVESLTARGVA